MSLSRLGGCTGPEICESLEIRSRRWVRLHGSWTRFSTAFRCVEVPYESLDDQSATRNAHLSPIRHLSAALSLTRPASSYTENIGLCPRLAIFYGAALLGREPWTVRESDPCAIMSASLTTILVVGGSYVGQVRSCPLSLSA